MDLIGKWQNQYGSVLEIVDDIDHKVTGIFKTALTDSGFYGKEVEVTGYHQGNCIGLAGGERTTVGGMIVTYTVLCRNGNLKVLWYVVADASITAEGEGQRAHIKENNWWRAMSTNADTFER